MPRPKNLASYPDEMFALIEGCALRGAVFERPVGSWEEAARVQGRFYAFKGALKRERDRLVGRAGQEQLLARLEEQLRWAGATVCWYDRLGTQELVVKYMNKDQTPEARALRKMLQSSREPAIQEIAGQAADSLARILEKAGPLPTDGDQNDNRS